MTLAMIAQLAWRSIWRNQRRTAITVVSIGIGLAIAIFFIAFADGVYAQMIDNVARTQAGHITLEDPRYRRAPNTDLFVHHATDVQTRIGRLDDVEFTKRLVIGQAIARTGVGMTGVAIAGVQPAVEARYSPLARHLVMGAYLTDGDVGEAVIGRELAARLHVGIGNKIVLTTNDIAGNLVDELCRVKGIFDSGSTELDGHLIQVPIGFATTVYRLPEDTATQIGVVLKRPQVQQQVLDRIRELVGNDAIAVRPWQEVEPEVASYIRLDRGSNWIFQTLLVMLVLFTIFNTVLMSVLERQREFAVLLAIGTPPVHLRWQVFVETAYLALLGCLAGLIGGAAAAGVMQWRGLDLRTFYPHGMTISGLAIDPVLHARLSVGILTATTGAVLTAILLLGLIPVRQATRVRIVEWLR